MDATRHNADQSTPLRLGRFDIRETLGWGAYGTVYRAYDSVLGRDVAIKVPRAALDSPEAQACFLREPRAAAQLRHPHIVPIYDAENDGRTYFIAAAFIEGKTLQQVLAERQIESREAATLVRSLAEALGYAHRHGVVHRDVKPGNIMIDQHGRALLMDFGLARLDCEESVTEDGAVTGSPAYMAPEQADRKFGEVGPASDQYGLGVVLYELLTGEPPFAGPPAVLIFNLLNADPLPPQVKKPGVAQDLAMICLKAMRKQPQDRYADCDELAEDLRHWLDGEPIHARKMSLVERAVRWGRQRPALAGLLLAVILLAVVSSVLGFRLYILRHNLVRALEYQAEQAGLVETARTDANEQRAMARERAKLANERAEVARANEKKARQATAMLQDAMQARADAEQKRREEEARGKQLESEKKRQESDVQKKAQAATEARKKSETAQQQRASLTESSEWLQYTQNLMAADAAYDEKDAAKKAEALRFLDACPEGQRAWEWQYLRGLCTGAVKRMERIVRVDGPFHGPLGMSIGGSVLADFPTQGRGRAQTTDVYNALTGESIGRIAGSSEFVSDQGLLLSDHGTGLRNFQVRTWDLIEARTGKTVSLKSVRLLGAPFSPQGGFLVVVQDDNLKCFLPNLRRFGPVLSTPAGYTLTGPIAFDSGGRLGVLAWKDSNGHGEETWSLLMWQRDDNGLPTGEPNQTNFRLLSDKEAQTADVPNKLTGQPRWDLPWQRAIREEGPTRLILANLGARFAVKDIERPVGKRPAADRRSVAAAVYSTSQEHPIRLLRGIVALSPDGKRTIAPDSNYLLCLWSVDGGRQLPPLKCLNWAGTKAQLIVLNPSWTCALVDDGAAIRLWRLTNANGDAFINADSQE